MTSDRTALFTTPQTLRLLGLSETELADLDLRALAALALSKGVRLSIREGGHGPGLTVDLQTEGSHVAR